MASPPRQNRDCSRTTSPSDEKFDGPAKIAVTLYINGVTHKLTVLWTTLVRALAYARGVFCGL